MTTHLVERTTEKPGAILTRVQVSGAVRDFSPRIRFQCRLSYGVRTGPVCIINICAHVKIPNTGSDSIVWTDESSTYSDRNR